MPARKRPEYVPNRIDDPNYVRIFDTTLRDGEQRCVQLAASGAAPCRVRCLPSSGRRLHWGTCLRLLPSVAWRAAAGTPEPAPPAQHVVVFHWPAAAASADVCASALAAFCLACSPGATLTSKEKLEIAKKLSQLGEQLII